MNRDDQMTDRTRPIVRARLSWIVAVALAASSVLAFPDQTEPLSEALQATERARTLIAEGQPDSALALADSAITIDSASLDAWMIKASVHAAKRQHAARIAALRHALKRAPSHPEALVRLTHAFLDSGLVDSAASHLPRHLLQRGPWEPHALYLHARILAAVGSIDSAVALYRHAFSALDRRELLYVTVGAGEKLQSFDLRSTEEDGGIWHPGSLTLFLFWATWSDASREALADIVARLPESSVSYRFIPINVDGPDLTVTLRDRVGAAASTSSYGDTVWYDRNLSLFRRWGMTHVPTVVVTTLNGQVELVVAGWGEPVRELILNRYLASSVDAVDVAGPTDPAELMRARALLGSARAFWRTGHHGQAMKQLSQALSVAPDFPLAHVQQAAWRWQRGDTLGARMAAYGALAADSSDPWSILAVARVEELHGHGQIARELLERCLANDPEFVPGWRHLGKLLAQSGDLTEAERAEATLRRLNPLDPGLVGLRAMIAELTGGPDRIEAWEAAVEAHLPAAWPSRNRWRVGR